MVGAHAEQREGDHRRLGPGARDDLRHLRVDVAVRVEQHALVAPRFVTGAVRLAEHDDRRIELVGREHVEERAACVRRRAGATPRETRRGRPMPAPNWLQSHVGSTTPSRGSCATADTPSGNPRTATRLRWAWWASQSATITLPFPSPSGDFGRSNTTKRLPCSASRPQNDGNAMADTGVGTQS